MLALIFLEIAKLKPRKKLLCPDPEIKYTRKIKLALNEIDPSEIGNYLQIIAK